VNVHLLQIRTTLLRRFIGDGLCAFIDAGKESQNSTLLIGALVHVISWCLRRTKSLNSAHSPIDQACVQAVPAIDCSNAVSCEKRSAPPRMPARSRYHCVKLQATMAKYHFIKLPS